MMARQHNLFPEPPRGPRIKRMRVVDAGNFPDGGKMIEFKCPHCGYGTGQIYDEHTVTENKRGLPCPACNPSGRQP